MKKTFSININGMLFNIDDEAFEKLNAYLKHLKKHFINTDGGEDIVSDIEARIAELFKAQLKELHNIVSLKDVDIVIETLGQPFEMDEENESNYSKKKNRHFKKRVFRDPDNQMLAGVASGLAAYFSVDPLVTRLLFALSILIGGVGIIVYLTLWILTPLATTTTEKLEMEGENIDIRSIEKKVTEELSTLKVRLKDFTNEAGDLIKQKRKESSGSLNHFGEIFHDAFRILLRALAIFFGVVFLAVGIALSIAFAAIYLGLTPAFQFDEFSIEALSFPTFLNTYIFSTPFEIVLNVALILVICIPVIALIYNGIRLLFNLGRQKILGIVTTVIWVLALSVAVTLSLKTLEEFKIESKQVTVKTLDSIQSDTLIVNVYNHQYYKELRNISNGSIYFQNDELILSSNDVFYGNPELSFEKAEGENFELIIRTSARGAYLAEAEERLANTKYYFEVKSNSLLLDPYFTLVNDEKWRQQVVNFGIKIPMGKTIFIDKETKHYFQWNYWQQGRRTMAGNYWIMTDDGLKNTIEPE